MSDNEAPANKEKLDIKKILPVFVIVFIDLLGLTIIIPMLPFYAATFGAAPYIIGAIGAAYPLMQFIGAPILGRISDRVGRRPVLIISQIGTLTGFIILGFSNALWMIFLSRIIDGISGANIATAQAVITDSTTEKNRTQGLGLIGAAFGLGFIVGPIIAFTVLALSNNNYPLVAFVAAAFSLASILLTYFWLEETLPVEKRGQGKQAASVGLASMLEAIRKPQVGFLLILMFAQQFAFGGYENFLALFTLNRLGMNAANNAALFVFAGIIIVAVQGGFVGRWSRRFGDRWVILMGLSVLGLGLVLTSITPEQPPPGYSKTALEKELSSQTTVEQNIQVGLPSDDNNGWLGLGWLLVATIPAAIGGGVLQPSINSMLTKQVAPDEVGGTLGISASFFSAANAITPLLMGFTFQFLGSTAPFLIGGIILWLLWWISRGRIQTER
ncbi:MAG: MFS transporter [Chloroflexi bacterium]|nr:MAG: MFS transporter [Chloroflexota bacterium]MBL1197289.1 MFS transporter [Chloroflexota bacterium]NOH14584.1 MFS transporter [Chloroflexota bacterium]